MSGKAQQQSRIKELITRGREQGYLTYAEVNDHLPEDISDPEQVEDIIRMINDMGINVFESAPDADALLLAEADTDEAAAATGHFDGLIASGWHTCCMAMRIVADEILQGSESFASPGIEKLQWLLPVRPGDALTVHLFVRDVRRSRKRPELGVLHWDWQIDNQRQQTVLRMDVTSMFKLPVE